LRTRYKRREWETVETRIVELYNERYEVNVRHFASITWKESYISPGKKSSLLQQDPSQRIALRDNAIAKSYDTLQQSIANGSKIAIVSISPDSSESAFILEELMIKFVNSRKFVVVDRHTLDTIRQEQRFQLTGEVSDESAISIGQFLGADVVITGNITGSDNQRRLRLKALDVKTAQILAMSSESI